MSRRILGDIEAQINLIETNKKTLDLNVVSHMQPVSRSPISIDMQNFKIAEFTDSPDTEKPVKMANKKFEIKQLKMINSSQESTPSLPPMPEK